MRTAFQAARKWFAAHPFAANIASSALVFSTGDALCQVVERRRFPPPPPHPTKTETDADLSCSVLPTDTVSLPISGSLDNTFESATATSPAPALEEPDQTTHAYDLPRVLRATAFGTGISVWLQFWWAFLQNSANSVVPVARYSKAANILFVVALDQAVGASIVNGGYFFTVRGYPMYLCARSCGVGRSEKTRGRFADVARRLCLCGRYLTWPTSM